MLAILPFLRLAGVFLFVCLSGCATKASLIGEPMPPAKPGFGYVAAAMVARVDSADPTHTFADVPSFQAYFEPAGEPKVPGFMINTYADRDGRGIWFDSKSKIPMVNGNRAVVLIPVQSGTYRLDIMDVHLYAYKRSLRLDKLNVPPFTVREGEITYIGSIDLTTTLGRNIFGMTLPHGLRANIIDNFESDWAAMQNADDRLKTMQVNNSFGIGPST